MRLEEKGIVTTLRNSLGMISNPENLDETVTEVFGTMLGLSCNRDALSGCSMADGESVTAVVGFGGVLSGACILRCKAETAQHLAGLLAGMQFDAVDDVVKDAIGEICNMLAGAWKSRVPELAANCGLSVPAVITGRDYRLHVQAPEFQICHQYSSAKIDFELVILCDGLQ